MGERPPLSLYIHIPWCVRKCPYCDFNSHQAGAHLDETAYIDSLLTDLAGDIPLIGDRPLHSIFIGGGTPSLFTPASIAALLGGIRARVALSKGMEITLEANPGTLEADEFAGYREAGVNRLSIGVQSFDAACLRALGRIHDPDEAFRAVERAKQAGFERLNLDLMFGLPGQTPSVARSDLEIALQLDPGHISYYQLTLEPNTPFYHAPPCLPQEDAIWRIQQQGTRSLETAGYGQYEISAFARTGQHCVHNVNYWSFGDYLGIGAGAHGKLTLGPGRIERFSKWRHPADYVRKITLGDRFQTRRSLTESDLILEFMMNRLRLKEGFEKSFFELRTGLPRNRLEAGLRSAGERGLMKIDTKRVETTAAGRLFLNDLLGLFIVE